MKPLTAFQAAEAFYDFFFKQNEPLSLIDYLNNSFCDEIGEINVKKNTIKLLFHVSNKYITPPTNCSYSDLIEFASSSIVHPDDKLVYQQLMDPKKIIDNLKKSPTKNFFFAHFRFLLKDGSYRYVEQAVITGKENGLADGICRFYIFDIENCKQRELGFTDVESTSYALEHDSNTGLLKEKSFLICVDHFLAGNKRKNMSIIMMDIEHFRLFDEWYGRETGDKLLAQIGGVLERVAIQNQGIAGYLGQDDFALLLPLDMKVIKYLYHQVQGLVANIGSESGFLPAIGVAPISKKQIVSDVLDKARLASEKAKSNFNQRIYVYHPEDQIKEEEEYRTSLEFMKALENDEVTFYLQPQCRISTSCIVGAEALARWVKKDGTVVPPFVFVPSLEKYGLITDMDKRVWEKVCQYIASMKEQGIDTVPISVNVSRIDIFTLDVAKYLKGLIRKYNLTPDCLKVEITESAYVDDGSDKARALVQSLRESGFMVLMDDFGSGYSSLNMLSNLNVDVIKLDGAFLQLNESDFSKGVHILESIINMAKNIGLPIIMEGVETKTQIEFLDSVGLRYVQGYYFYKPLPIDQFTELLKVPSHLDHRGLIAKGNEQFRIREFMDQNVYSDQMLNSIIGPAAVYAVKGDQIDIVRYNQQFYEAVSVPNFAERLSHIEQFMPKDERQEILQAFNEAKRNRLTGASGLYHFLTPAGTSLAFFIRFFYMGEQEGYDRYYGAATNTTVLTDLQLKWELLSKISSDTIVFVRLDDKQNIIFTVATHGLEDKLSLTKEALQLELDNKTFWKRVKESEVQRLKKLILDSMAKKKDFKSWIEFQKDDKNKVRLHIEATHVDEMINGVEYILKFK